MNNISELLDEIKKLDELNDEMKKRLDNIDNKLGEIKSRLNTDSLNDVRK